MEKWQTRDIKNRKIRKKFGKKDNRDKIEAYYKQYRLSYFVLFFSYIFTTLSKTMEVAYLKDVNRFLAVYKLVTNTFI